MSENLFFQRNTITNFTDYGEKSLLNSKIKSKRAKSVVQLNTNPGKFQHREVFDSKLYQKVNFFNLGLQDLKKESKIDKINGLEVLSDIIN